MADRSLKESFARGGTANKKLPDQTHGERLLDEALEESFPASDPIAPASVMAGKKSGKSP